MSDATWIFSCEKSSKKLLFSMESFSTFPIAGFPPLGSQITVIGISLSSLILLSTYVLIMVSGNNVNLSLPII